MSVQVSDHPRIGRKLMNRVRYETGRIGIPVIVVSGGKHWPQIPNVPEGHRTIIRIPFGKKVNSMQISGHSDEVSAKKAGKHKHEKGNGRLYAAHQCGNYGKRTDKRPGKDA